mmetsp:Transcript_22913/g.71390  ORF Transcript_22913/g.71390 Transcript_22913/m.71390 type:complete len:259 (-) Transcript_22913:163-939(-)
MHIPCCAYLLHSMVSELATVADRTGVEWHLWKSALLGAARNKQIMPWRSQLEVAVAGTFIRKLPAALSAFLFHKGQYQVVRFKNSYVLHHASPLPLWYPPAAWAKFNVTARRDADWWAPHVLRISSPNCATARVKSRVHKGQDGREKEKCYDDWQPAFLRIIYVAAISQVERLRYEALLLMAKERQIPLHFVNTQLVNSQSDVWKSKIELIDSSISSIRVKIRSDYTKLLTSWYGSSWAEPNCDWLTGLGNCVGYSAS